MPLLGVGVDVVEVARVDRLLDRHGDRFVSRWFTPAEISWARRAGRPAVAFSAVLAGKEAVWKSLPAQATGPVPWRSLQVLPAGGAGGQVTLPPGLAPDATAFHLSVSSEARHVLAWVLAWSAPLTPGEEDRRGRRPQPGLAAPTSGPCRWS